MGDTVTGNPTSHPYTGPIDLTRPHFVGIGGLAMSGLAKLCAERGSEVTGTDSADSERLEALRALGCKVTVGHSAEAVVGASCVVYTTAAAQAADVAAARDAGIPIVHRAQVLQEIVGDRRLIAVTGSHGKSTTTGVLATALTALNEDPTYLIGADLNEPGSGARTGKGDLFVVEADESDRSFHFLTPAVVVVTNIEHDHPENYTSLDDVLSAYVTFALRLRHQGVLVVNADSPVTERLVKQVRRARPDVQVVTFGKDKSSVVQLTRIKVLGWNATAQVDLQNGEPVALRLKTPSREHLHDAVAALAVLVQLGANSVEAAEAINTFAEMPRRFARYGKAGGVTVVDCFSDHHNEIAADLRAARSIAGSRKVIAVFQPTGFARVKAFGKEMGAALADGADVVILLDIRGYVPEEGVSSVLVGDSVVMNDSQVRYASEGGPVDLVAAHAHPGDVVVLMGTGDVTDLAEPILATLEVNAGHSVR
ncbi:UDP-N-acetylmuramate--L-alanine ligase [Actinoplanes ianthinogenes]|uniref:UDP-N-acetylmuramate--L-alanine ligase n=1 Tax=Actinoplanes ianthinogenes TaxID=122358 RepID=A0ABN6C8I8_9ACTN|nr:Mur ligase family protein [Actinoplanes ianthinogenes]BCJ41710.1 UDP-N-acetylmuramate--L-alanine ligase [Actinoplanes ianthinogenes]GGR28259.1 UDP-N-acetylmuramate--L-alanine ligase [Actinoplanes ianthinogenes]